MTPPKNQEILNKSILVVEDNDYDFNVFSKDLLSKGLSSVTRKTTLESTLDLLSHRSFDFIILDLGLPDSQGLETYLAVEEANRGRAKIIIRTQHPGQITESNAVFTQTPPDMVLGKGDGTREETLSLVGLLTNFIESRAGGYGMPEQLRPRDPEDPFEKIQEYYSISRADLDGAIEFVIKLYQLKETVISNLWKLVGWLLVASILGGSALGAFRAFFE